MNTTNSSKRSTPVATAVCAALVWSLSAFAQAQTQDPSQLQPDDSASLTLFEPIEQSSSGNQNQTSGPRNPAVASGGTPQFALVGTSRFGDRYRVSVRDSNGDVITVDADAGAGSDAAIPGYPGFSVTRVAPREVLLQHPDSTPCFDFSDQGVTCEGGNTARLALATAAPVAPPPEPERRRDRRDEERDADDRAAADADEQSAEGQPVNPFAAALRAARERGEPDAAASRAEEQRFRPRRIDPADVREGYRVIRTPFGDREVPL